MLFHTLAFLALFLPASLSGYYFLARNEKQRCWFLGLLSLVFYGAWDVRFVPLILASIVGNWLALALFFRTRRISVIHLAVALNLVVLCLFKYLLFFSETLNQVAGTSFTVWHFVLPLGISFFTFHQISYLLDAKHGHAPLYSFGQYLLYVTFFPQLIAGPIVRAHEVIPQYALNPWRSGLAERIGRGCLLFTIGMAKKLLLADPLGALTNPLYKRALGEALPFTDAWTALLSFCLQIYFDFSGYTDMALGLALLFGLALPQNFNAPYRALSVQDFWRRWHMSLSRFFRDYLYIPMGGSRAGLPRYIFAIMATMLLCGLWHGAAWGFVIWGGVHGLGLVAHTLWRKQPLRLPEPLAWMLTFAFVTLAWVFFRAENFTAAWHVLGSLTDWHQAARLPIPARNLLMAGLVLALIGPTSQQVCERFSLPSRIIGAALAAALVIMLLYAGNNAYQSFVYFIF